MKYSNYIGCLAALALIGCCFVPWVYIESIKTTITGVSAEHTNFGKPGLLHIIFSAIAIVLYLVPKIWAKRTSLFICTFNFAWALRNYLLITHCELGECPQKKAGIYVIIVLSLLMLAMSTLPKVKLNEQS